MAGEAAMNLRLQLTCGKAGETEWTPWVMPRFVMLVMLVSIKPMNSNMNYSFFSNHIYQKQTHGLIVNNHGYPY